MTRLRLLALIACCWTLHASAAPAADSPRQRVRMDADWRFQLDGANGGAAVTGWRWKSAEHPAGNATPPSASDALGADWKDAAVGQDVFNRQRGFAWFVASIPANAASASLGAPSFRFESVDDTAEVFLNGQRIGEHKGWSESFDVSAGAAWKKGAANVLAILVENTDGAGGIDKEVTLRAGLDVAAPEATPGFDDQGWRTVQLPHDYVVEGPFDPKAKDDHGYRPTPRAWYRKTFTLPADWKNKSVWIDFDGIGSDAHIWLNGQFLGSNRSGYIGARFDIGKLAKFGEKNVLAVHVDPSKFEGWWYEGGGIYRHVWLNAADLLHIEPDTLFVKAKSAGLENGQAGPAKLTAELELTNLSAGLLGAHVVWEILSPDGSALPPIGDSTAGPPVNVHPGQNGGLRISVETSIDKPEVWSLETPRLYRLRAKVVRAGKVIDEQETNFGIRDIHFDADKGLLVNGKPVKIQGVCNHQDSAVVGIGIPDGVFEWRVKKLKEFGTNAWRTSHNPVAPELLDACDRLGMLVMDETRHLGDTYEGKTPHGTKADDLGDLEKMVRRDRNHPSIFLWSVANEEPLQASPDGARIARAMKERIDKLDGTRPVSAAMNGSNSIPEGFTSVVDAEGFNYHPSDYDSFHQKFPKLPAYGSEITSAVTTRGEYAREPFKNGAGHFFGDQKKGYVAAYDINAPNWAQTTEHAWKMLAERPFMAGGFVWTGFDYRGEQTPYVWPCVNSHFGFLDMCGFPKDDAFYYVAWWKTEPMAHVFPHWNWPADKGEVEVWVYSNSEKVELLLNGKSLGKQDVPRWGHLEWKVPYATGKLEARGYRGDKVEATDVVETSGPAAGLKLHGERTEIAADKEDMGIVAVDVLDAQDRIVPTADNPVTFEVSGPATIAGTGSGDPSSHEPEQGKDRRAFNGKCMVLVRATGEPGDITVTATAPGLKPASIVVHSKACDVKDAE